MSRRYMPDALFRAIAPAISRLLPDGDLGHLAGPPVPPQRPQAAAGPVCKADGQACPRRALCVRHNACELEPWCRG